MGIVCSSATQLTLRRSGTGKVSPGIATSEDINTPVRVDFPPWFMCISNVEKPSCFSEMVKIEMACGYDDVEDCGDEKEI